MKTIIAIIAVLLLIAACSNSQKQIDPGIDDTNLETPNTPIDNGDITAVEDELSEIDTLDEDLDFSELDSLESDLNFG